MVPNSVEVERPALLVLGDQMERKFSLLQLCAAGSEHLQGRLHYVG